MLRSNTTASLLSRLQPQTIPKDAAINIIKRSLPHIQAGMETMRDLATQSSIPGIEAIFTLCIAILSYYNKESKTSETITSLGVLIANIANSLTLLIRNPALEPLVVGLEHVLNEVKTVIEEEQKALQEKGFHKVLHVFTKAEKVEKKVVEYHQQLVRARNDLDFRIQVQTHNSIEQIAESFILQRVTVEDGFAGLAERIGTGNEKIMTLLAEILETQVTHAVQPPSGVYEYLGSLMELDGQVDERPILSKSLTVTSIRKDIQESYDPKLNDFDGFTLKLKYTDKKTNRERIVDVNPKMLETCIGSGIYDDVVMLIERNPAGVVPFDHGEQKPKLVISEGDSSVVVSVDSSFAHSFTELQSAVNSMTDIHITTESTVVTEGTNFSAPALIVALNSATSTDQRIEVNVLHSVPSIQEIHSDAVEPLQPVSYSDVLEYDVMISFCGQSSKDLVNLVVEELRARGLVVWFDEDERRNDMLNRMAEAVTKSHVFCMFLNPEYQQSYYCQLEYGYAAAKHKPIVIALDSLGELKPDAMVVKLADSTQSSECPDFTSEFYDAIDLLHSNILTALETAPFEIISRKSTVNEAIDSGNVLHDWLNPVDFSDDLKRFEEAYVPPTRQWMLKNLVDWINRDSQSVLCLLGGAGVGKSVFAWLAHHNPQEYDCPAIFFCRHNSERKNNAKNVVSSLAYQLALYSPEYAAYLFEVQWMEAAEEASNPDMIPVTQRGDAFKKLILDGLHHIRVPEGRNLLVIVDALDECEKPGSLGRMNLLLTIKDYHKSLPKGMKLLVTSRPEEDIVIALESIQPDQMLIQQQQAIRDVFFYLEVKFTKMCADAKMFFSLDMRDAAARLADASQGVFVFAALACNQLSEVDTQDRNGFKKEFLEMVATLCEGGGNMDSIYVPFLEMHYKDAGPQDFSMFKSFMGVVTALSIALTGESVALILKVPSYMVDAIVLRIGSILHAPDGRIRVLHKSVKDFLTTRCVDPRFGFSIKKYHDLITAQCFKLVLLSSECDNPELRDYANSYWTYHLASGNGNHDHLENLKLLVEGDCYHLISWFQALLRSNQRVVTIQSHIMGYLAKIKEFETLKAEANRLERIFQLTFSVFGDTFRVSEWDSLVDKFLMDLFTVLEDAAAAVDGEDVEEETYDFYISFEASSADTALSLLMTLESEGHRACLMNHAPDQVAAAKDQSRILNSTVYLVLVTQKYEDSKQCRLDFAYAKSYDRGMLGVFLEPELGVRGDASTCLRREFWTMSSLDPKDFEHIPLLFKLKYGFHFASWEQFRMGIDHSMKRSAINRGFNDSIDMIAGTNRYKELFTSNRVDLSEDATAKYIGRLTQLNWLDLREFGLKGAIPSEIGSLSELTRLDLAHNELIGSIPGELGALKQLNWMFLSGNMLGGPIPSELGNLANLTWLDLSFCQLSGAIPSSLGNLSQLLQLNLSYNKLSGEIPVELANLSKLTKLKLDNNQLTGSIPKEFGRLSRLSQMNLSFNNLTGTIPIEFGSLTGLVRLKLTHNQLSGIVPNELKRIRDLSHLWLEGNSELFGPLPNISFGVDVKIGDTKITPRPSIFRTIFRNS